VTDQEPDNGAGPVHADVSTSAFDAWWQNLAAGLGVDEGVVDIPALLQVACEAAHCGGRPAAPVTAFLIGYAAGQGPFDVGDALARTTGLADRWAARGTEITGTA
jgi:hypothetical protein